MAIGAREPRVIGPILTDFVFLLLIRVLSAKDQDLSKIPLVGIVFKLFPEKEPPLYKNPIFIFSLFVFGGLFFTSFFN